MTTPKPEPISVAMLVKADVTEAPQENPFYSKIIWGIEDACRKDDISLIFLPSQLTRTIIPVKYHPY
jgi:hypothetical protein